MSIATCSSSSLPDSRARSQELDQDIDVTLPLTNAGPVSATTGQEIRNDFRGDADGWSLPDGTRIHVRELRPDDRALEVAFLESLSEATRYFRLMTPLKYLSRDLLDLLMDVNGIDRAALVASVVSDDQERFVGIARYAADGKRNECELGITVTDAWQHQGIASALIERLIDHARRRGVRRMMGFVLPDNHRMLALARKLGFAVHLDIARKEMCIEMNLTVPRTSDASST